MASFARWCYRHRRIVVIAWLAVLISVIGIERAVGSAYSETFTLPGTESSQAQTLLASALPKQAGDSDTIVWHVRDGSVNDPNVQARIQALLAEGGGGAVGRGRAQRLRLRRRGADQPRRQDRLRDGRLHAAGAVAFPKRTCDT